MTPRELLIFGKNKIETYGWVQNRFGTKETGFCMIGCMLSDTGRIDEGAGSADKYLQKAIGENSIAKWNDSPNRTNEQVLNAFDKAIELAAEDEK